MNISYDKTSSEKIIGNFTVSNNLIYVTYLDGTITKEDYSIENYNWYINKMLQQAKEMDKLKSSTLVSNSIFNKYCIAVGTLLESASFATLANSIFNNEHKVVDSIIAAVMGLTFLTIGLSVKRENDEFSKYHIYLSIMDDIKKYINNDKLKKGIGKNIELLDIHTLDDYSLREIKKLDHNIKGIEKKQRTRKNVK